MSFNGFINLSKVRLFFNSRRTLQANKDNIDTYALQANKDNVDRSALQAN